VAAPTLNVTPPFDRIRRGGKSILVNSAGHGVMNDLGAGVVHADASGVLTSSAIAESDIASFVDASYTPVLKGDATAGTHTYTTQVGRYYRIGSIVFVTFFIALTTKGTAGNAMSGNICVSLPLTARNTTNLRWAAAIGHVGTINLATGQSQFGGEVLPNTANLILLQSGDTIATATFVDADIGTAAQIAGSITYLI
jgi:hypothetical protein